MDGTSPCKSRAVVRSAWPAIIAFATVAGCSTYIGTTPKSFLHQIRSNPDPNIRYLAYAKLGSPELYNHPDEKSEAVKVLIAKLSEGKEPLAVRAVIIRSLGDLGDRRARDVVARAVNDSEAVIRTEACRALGKVGRPEDVTILAGVMAADNLEDCRIAAIEGIGALKAQDPRIFHVLIEGMDHDDPAIRLSCYRALKRITGKDLGSTPDPWRRELEPQAVSPDRPGDASASKPQEKTKTR
jgi:HEAT repeat protein